MKRNVIDIITLGCSKNLVDSERLMGMLEYVGFECTHDSEQPEGEIAIINTCGFIGDAKEESINTILEFVNRKNNGLLKKIYVMGCLSQRYKEELEKEIPEVDKFYGKFDVKTLVICASPQYRHAMGAGISRLRAIMHTLKLLKAATAVVLIAPFRL